MATQELLTLFLASPGDVNPERDIVQKVVDECNESIGKPNGVRVEVNRWETHARPAWGKDGQAIINQQIADMKNHVLFVGIMWNRFGTKTPRAASGTREEYDLAMAARRQTRGKRPEIMFYFGTAPANLKSKADLAQKASVFDFQAEIQKKKAGLYWTFNGPANFETLFRAHYSSWLNAYIAARPIKTRALKPPAPGKPAPTKPKPSKAAPPKPEGEPILLGDNLFFAKVTEKGAQWTVIVRPQNTAEDDQIRALVGSNSRHQGFPLAYDKQAGRAQLTTDAARARDDEMFPPKTASRSH